MRASTLATPVLLVTLGAAGMLGCESTARDPMRPVDRSVSTAALQASVRDCVPPTFPDPGAPVALIVSPIPNPGFVPAVPPDFTVTWSGSDADGRVRGYRFRLFGRANPDFPEIYDFVDHVLTNPQVIEDLYGPCFENWDSAPAHVTSHTYNGLQVNEKYLFAVTAFDNDGKHDSYFNSGANLLALYVASPQSLGPLLSFTSGSWSYTYPTGGYLDDPSRYVDLAVAPGVPVTVQWSAQPLGVTPLAGYRWGLDLADLGRDGPRGSGTPPGRWTPRRLDNTSATVGPFGPGETHLLYVDVTDAVGWSSLGIVRLNVSSSAAGLAGLRESGGSR